MSCPESRRNIDEKPPDAEDKTHIWSLVKDHPNLYCWIPVSKKDVSLDQINLDEVSIQDIPPPPEYPEAIAAVGALAEGEIDALRLKELKEGTDIVSADDPRKYPIVKQFIVDKGLKLYGGAAINMYMPRKAKFYSAQEIPDYDFYSPDPWNHAVELGEILYSAGYKYVEVKAGIHHGTYKVYANLWPVADITYMPSYMFKQLKSRKIQGFHVVSPLRLYEDMYKELSQPSQNPSRWPKVATRMKLLEEYAPPFRKNMKCRKDIFLGGKVNLPVITQELLTETKKFIDKKKMLIGGMYAYNVYMTIAGAKRRALIDHYDVYSETAHQDIQDLLTRLLPLVPHPRQLVVTFTNRLSTQMNEKRYGIFYRPGNHYEAVCFINQLTMCTPLKKFSHFGKIVSVDYLKYNLFTQAVFGSTKNVKIVKCLIKYLDKAQKHYYVSKNVSEFDDTPFQRFMYTCEGPVASPLKKALEKRWHLYNIRRELKRKRRTIPPECLNKEKQDCEYPCVWNDQFDRCMGLPWGVVRVEHEEDVE